MSGGELITKAVFDDKVCSYWLLTGSITMIITVVGIVFLPFWVILGFVLTKKYLDKMECLLTEKSLKVGKGILVRTEKTIPLEKITDMGMVQGPIMRMFGLYTLTVETAGQSGMGALVSLTGIVNAKAFRERVLAQRDALASGAIAPVSSAAVPQATPQTITGTVNNGEVLTEIRDALLRIEKKLDK